MARGPLRSVPARPDVALDVIPVDLVARGLTLCAAALVAGRAPPVVHLASGDLHPLTVRRAVDLTALAARPDDPGWRALLAPAAEVTGDAAYRALGAPLLRRLAAGAHGLLDAAARNLPEDGAAARRLGALARDAARAERRLGDLEATVARYRHFLEHDQTFVTAAAPALALGLPPAERAAFGFDPTTIDWRAYWLDVHVPGLRRWVWPRLEGRPVERTPRRPVVLQPVPDPAPHDQPVTAEVAR
jgi:long-chain acyl-CoA synthetase